MVRTSRRSIGNDAEDLVFRYLRQHGLKPVARNFRTRRGEIDIVMIDDDCVVFVEVRYRTANSFVDSFLTVDRRKQRKLSSAAAMFLSRNGSLSQRTCRFDVVGVDRDANDDVSLRWIRDAFRPQD